MALKRRHSWDEIAGHPNIVEYFKSHLAQGTLPQQILLYGPEGLGKTTMADLIAVDFVYGVEDSVEKQKALTDVIDGDKSNASIKKFKMSVDGGKDVAKEVLEEFTVSMTPYGKKVIILDECHGMSDAAQDVFLSATEYMPKGLLIIMLTTELKRIKPTLQSRFFSIMLRRLKQKEMITLLQKTVAERQLNIQGGDATLSLIANWADFKPRKALKMLDGFADGTTVASSLIKEMIGYLELEDVIPILNSLSNSMAAGLAYISDMEVTNSLLDIMIEVLKVKLGHASYKLSYSEYQKVRSTLATVSEECVITFVSELASDNVVSKTTLIRAFLKAHKAVKDFKDMNYQDVLRVEAAQKAAITPPPVTNVNNRAPSIDELRRNANVVRRG